MENYFMPPAENPKSHVFFKIMGLLVLGSVAFGALVYFGVNIFKDRLTHSRSETMNPNPPVPTQAMATPIQISTPPPEEPSLVLARQLVAGDIVTRKEISAQLANINGSLIPAIEFLTVSLTKAPPEVKLDIVSALGLLAKKDSAAIAPLMTALDDKSLRREAIPALGALGPTAKPAVSKLKIIAGNKKERKTIRKAAWKALGQIQGKKPAGKSKRGRKRIKSN